MSLELVNLLIRHEDIRQYPYFDCCGKPFRKCGCAKQGKLTIGIGRNLEDTGVSPEEAVMLLDEDIRKAVNAADQEFAWFSELDRVRKDVIADMIVNLGITRFKTFKRMITALERRDYVLAAAEMLDSKWKVQVKNRALRLAEMMKTGEYP